MTNSTDIQERETIASEICDCLIDLARRRRDKAKTFIQDAFDITDRILALRSNPQPGSEGYRLVPVEPTKAMLDAGYDAGVEWGDTRDNAKHQRRVWSAMLAASPTPPTAQPGEVERLRAALEPFANLGVTSGPDDEPCSIPYRITRGSIRRARTVLNGET